MRNAYRRKLEPPLGPSVLAARNKEMKTRLSSSSLVLGDVGPETRDWSLSSTQQRPGAGALDGSQRENNLAMKKGVPTTSRRQFILSRARLLRDTYDLELC